MTDPYESLFRRTTAGIKPGLDVIAALLEALGNPHHRLAAVHVAGTNGKGSACAMIESVLRASGFKTGLYTSPHLIDFSERFRINGEVIARDRLHEYIALMEEKADEVEQATGLRGATFFEISTAIAFQYFADEAVDIAIIETGMGGRWDASNVLIPLVSVITHIDVDHTDYLGDTIEQIAAEKAGIIKSGRPAVSAPQSDAVMAELRKRGEPIHIVDGASCSVTVQQAEKRDEAGNFIYVPCQRLKIETPSRSLPPINLPLLGECQRENCAIAVAALEVLADMLDFDPAFKRGLEAVEWGARFQVIEQDPLMILDGAHNPSAAQALVKTVRETFPKHQVGFILGFLADKDSAGFMRVIKPTASRVWTIPIDAQRGSSAEDSAMQARAVGLDVVPLDVAGAWAAARTWSSAEPNRLVCITGTLYMVPLFGQSIPAVVP